MPMVDRRVYELEIAEILKHLADGDTVMDCCANGYSTRRFAAARKIDVLGVDYIPRWSRTPPPDLCRSVRGCWVLCALRSETF